MKTTDDKTSAGLVSALRHLAHNPDKKVSAVAAKFNVPEKKMWEWLGAHNRSKKDLSESLLDRVLAAERSAPATKAVAAAVRSRINKAVRQPGRLAAPPECIVSPAKPPALTSELEVWLKAQGLAPASTALTYLVEVTPAIAASWLLLNQGNRNPSKAKIRRFAAAIKAGQWCVNGETIKFSVTGRLLDGQSRLRAIVLAGVPAVLEIRAGLPDVAQQSMDIGETRKGTHTLEMLGEKYPQVLAPALKLVWLQESGRLGWTQAGKLGILENMAIIPLLERHAELKASVGWVMTTGMKLEALMQSSAAAFFHYVFGRANRTARDAFFSSLATGIGLKETSPVYHLREALLAYRAEGMHRARPIELRGLVIKAWNAFRANERLTSLTFRKGEDFPAIAGLKAPAQAA